LAWACAGREVLAAAENASAIKHALSRRPPHIRDGFPTNLAQPRFAGCHLIAINLYG
jgi:hypothetical protein